MDIERLHLHECLNLVPLTVVTNPEEKPVHTGDSFIQLTCTGKGNPPPTLSWTKKGNLNVISGNPGKYLVLQNGNLIITGFDIEHDTGIYYCNGSNGQEQGGDSSICKNQLRQSKILLTLSIFLISYSEIHTFTTKTNVNKGRFHLVLQYVH